MARGYPMSMVPAIVASLIVFIIMVLVTLSTPVWDSVYFLKLIVPGSSDSDELTVTFGVLGSTGKSQRVGWIPAEWPLDGSLDPRVDSERLANITYALLLHPIAAISAIISLSLSFLGLSTRRAGVLSAVTSVITSVMVLVAFTVDIVLFSILKVRFLDSREPPEGSSISQGYQQGDDETSLRETRYGPALWLTLTAVIVSIVSVVFTVWTVARKAVYPRKWDEPVPTAEGYEDEKQPIRVVTREEGAGRAF